MTTTILEFPATTDTRTPLEIVRDYYQDATAVHRDAYNRGAPGHEVNYHAGKVDAAMELLEALEQAQEDRV